MNPFKTILLILMMLGLAACGTTLEKQENRFKKNTDTLEAVAAKQPKLATAIKAKLKGFATERDGIIKAGGEDAKTKLARLNGRMEAYAVKLDPSLAPKKAAAKSTKSAGQKGAKAKQPASKAAASKAPMSKAPATASKLAAPASAGSKLVAPGTAAPVSKLGAGSQPAKPAGKLGAGSQPAKPASKLGAGSQPAKPAGSQPVKPGTR